MGYAERARSLASASAAVSSLVRPKRVTKGLGPTEGRKEGRSLALALSPPARRRRNCPVKSGRAAIARTSRPPPRARSRGAIIATTTSKHLQGLSKAQRYKVGGVALIEGLLLEVPDEDVISLSRSGHHSWHVAWWPAPHEQYAQRPSALSLSRDTSE